MDIFARFATDEKLENSGTWRDIGGGCRLLVARAGNRAYQKLLTKQYELNRAVLDLGDDTAAKKNDEIMVDVMAQTVLLGWDGPLDFKKKPVGDYSVDKARELLQVKDFRRLVADMSNDMEAYLMKEEAAQGEA